MVVDASALVAVLFTESEHERLASTLFSSRENVVSAATVLELQLVLGRSDLVDATIEQFDLQVIPVDVEQLRYARRAAQEYGKGTGHIAQLNYGDCFTYALAIQYGEPLLFVGDDFVHTDVKCVQW